MTHKLLLSALAGLGLLVGAPTLAAQSTGHAGHNHGQSQAVPTDIPEAIKQYAFKTAPYDHIIGNADAPVTFIVYASVTCPHCAQWFAEDYPVIKANYLDTGKARMVFREFPTAPGPIAVAGFMIANCSGDQFIDSIVYQMANQKQTMEGLQSAQGEADIMSVFGNIGAQTGLSQEQTMSCMNNSEGLNRIQNSMDLAKAAGISGVPAISVGDTMYGVRDTSADRLSTIIDAKIGSPQP